MIIKNGFKSEASSWISNFYIPQVIAEMEIQ